MNALRAIESVHGYLGVLAVVSLLHPALTLRRGKPLAFRTRLSVLLSTAITACAFAVGLSIYGDYRATVKPGLFAAAPSVGYLFETKEHLAYATICLALGACGCALLAPRDAAGVRRTASLMYLGAFIAALATASLGTYVAAFRSF